MFKRKYRKGKETQSFYAYFLYISTKISTTNDANFLDTFKTPRSQIQWIKEVA